jgi:prolyl oligopeptidase
MPLTAPIEEILHGVAIKDPYRWLEERNLPETQAWIHDQRRRCNAYFAGCPGLARFERLAEEYLDVEVVDQPARVASHYFYRKRHKGQEQGAIYVREIPNKRERMLIDPSEEGLFTSVGICCISPDARYLAYEVKRGGGDRKEIRFFDVQNGVALNDSIPFGYGRGLVFTCNGYCYCHETANATYEHTIRCHSWGSIHDDQVVFRVPRTSGSRLLLSGNEHRLGATWLRLRGADVIADFSIAEINHPSSWREVFREKRMPYNAVLCHDRILLAVENATKRWRIAELSEEGRELRTVVPGTSRAIRQLVITKDRLLVQHCDLGVTTIDAWLYSGHYAGSVSLPAGGTIRILHSQVQDANSFFYSFESFDTPPAIYEYCANTDTSTLWHQREPVTRKRPCHVQETAVSSTDGTSIPLTLVSLDREDPATRVPVIMTSYGGFGIATTPRFSVLVAIMMELGAVLAIPHIRGGGEFGEAWHQAGRARNRQKAFDDFIAVAEWLCRQGITAPEKLGIFGGSNSGLLVGAALTQRPDLFGAALCIAPILDMLRYESFDHAARWRNEYGTVEDPDDFRALYAYSPYHHVAANVNYPATMLVSGDEDDRCNPAHVRKMAARLQEHEAQESPVIVDYSVERGHFPALPLSVRVPALARRLAFLCRQLQIDPPDGGFK